MPLLQALSQEANIQSDPYLYPDTSVLCNLADIRDASRLSQFESDPAKDRWKVVFHIYGIRGKIGL